MPDFLPVAFLRGEAHGATPLPEFGLAPRLLPKIETEWLFSCYSCRVRPAGVLLLLLLVQHHCINYSKF